MDGYKKADPFQYKAQMQLVSFSMWYAGKNKKDCCPLACNPLGIGGGART
jgi:hypothetical protein